MTRVEKAQLLDGNWNIRPTAGDYFARSDFGIVSAVPAGAKRVRAWDLAATKKTNQTLEQKENDQTANHLKKIAEKLDMNYATVRSKVQRGRKNLKNIFEE